MKETAFVGRKKELDTLRKFSSKPQKAHLTALYGRRRIGKTRLIREAFKNYTIFSFEGLEGENSKAQKVHFMKTLYRHSKSETHRLIKDGDWEDLLITLSEYVAQKPCVIFFDEFQWMAAERTELVSKLKYVWDNYFIHQKVHLVLCGSISSFLVKKVIRSKALYGRIDTILHLQPLAFNEVREGFLRKRSVREALEGYLVMGGVPKYLELLDSQKSIRLNIATLFFGPDSFFIDEFDRLFTSHFGKNQNYRLIIEFLAQKSFATRESIAKYLGIKSGGRISELLENLALAGFIEQYSPIQFQQAKRIHRYRIADPFLKFHFRFLAPMKDRIRKSSKTLPINKALPENKFSIFLGFSFELFCYNHAHQIAKILGFSAITYDFGSWFTRKNLNDNSQIDSVFIRADNVITLCEVTFRKNIDSAVIRDVEKKELILEKQTDKTIEKVLVTVYPPSKSVENSDYFTKIVLLEDLF